MGRKRLKLGGHGDIRSYYQHDGKWVRHTGKLPDGIRPKQWRAMTQYRDYDGHVRQIERSGNSQTAAKNALRDYLNERSGQKVELSERSTVAEAAQVYLEQVRLRRSVTTYQRYTKRINNHVIPALGGLLLRECTVGRLERFMTELEQRGLAAETRRGIRSVLSGLLGMASRQELIAHNPVPDISPIEGGPRTSPTAMTVDELSDFLTRLDADEGAVNNDLPDYLRFIFGTGVRFGEALAVRWRDVNLSDEPVTIDDQVIPPESVWINGNIVHVTGEGLVRMDGKTPSANRIIGLPRFLYTLLLVRKPIDAAADEPVFPSANLGWHHPSNVQRAIRETRVRIGHPTFHTHKGRKTVATMLDHAGQSARQVADQLGHANPAMTLSRYMGRGQANPDAAKALDQIHQTQ